LIDTWGQRATAEEEFPSEVLKRIVGYAGIHDVLAKTSRVQKFESLFQIILERNLVFPEEE